MIRQAAQNDIGRLGEILVFAKRISYRAIFQDDVGSFVHLSVVSIIQRLQQPHALDGMLVYDDDFVKGMAHVQYTAQEAELLELYVDPFFQGKAIGSCLLREAERQCHCKAIPALRLWVLQENRSGIMFYEQHGFSFTGRQEYEEGTTIVKLEYQKKLV